MSPPNLREKNFAACSAAAPAVGDSHRRRERACVIICYSSTVLLSGIGHPFCLWFQIRVKEGNRGSGLGSSLLWLSGRFAWWWARRLLYDSGDMFNPVPEPLKVSSQARAYDSSVCEHSEVDA